MEDKLKILLSGEDLVSAVQEDAKRAFVFEVFPEIQGLVDFPQGGHFHYDDVWEHTLDVMRNLKEILPHLSEHFGGIPEVEQCLSKTIGGYPICALLYLTGLLHDIGMPQVGEDAQFGRHEESGVEIIDAKVKGFTEGMSPKVAGPLNGAFRVVTQVVEHHSVLRNGFSGNKIPERLKDANGKPLEEHVLAMLLVHSAAAGLASNIREQRDEFWNYLRQTAQLWFNVEPFQEEIIRELEQIYKTKSLKEQIRRLKELNDNLKDRKGIVRQFPKPAEVYEKLLPLLKHPHLSMYTEAARCAGILGRLLEDVKKEIEETARAALDAKVKGQGQKPSFWQKLGFYNSLRISTHLVRHLLMAIGYCIAPDDMADWLKKAQKKDKYCLACLLLGVKMLVEDGMCDEAREKLKPFRPLSGKKGPVFENNLLQTKALLGEDVTAPEPLDEEEAICYTELSLFLALNCRPVSDAAIAKHLDILRESKINTVESYIYELKEQIAQPSFQIRGQAIALLKDLVCELTIGSHSDIKKGKMTLVHTLLSTADSLVAPTMTANIRRAGYEIFYLIFDALRQDKKSDKKQDKQKRVLWWLGDSVRRSGLEKYKVLALFPLLRNEKWGKEALTELLFFGAHEGLYREISELPLPEPVDEHLHRMYPVSEGDKIEVVRVSEELKEIISECVPDESGKGTREVACFLEKSTLLDEKMTAYIKVVKGLFTGRCKNLYYIKGKDIHGQEDEIGIRLKDEVEASEREAEQRFKLFIIEYNGFKESMRKIQLSSSEGLERFCQIIAPFKGKVNELSAFLERETPAYLQKVVIEPIYEFTTALEKLEGSAQNIMSDLENTKEPDSISARLSSILSNNYVSRRQVVGKQNQKEAKEQKAKAGSFLKRLHGKLLAVFLCLFHKLSEQSGLSFLTTRFENLLRRLEKLTCKHEHKKSADFIAQVICQQEGAETKAKSPVLEMAEPLKELRHLYEGWLIRNYELKRMVDFQSSKLFRGVFKRVLSLRFVIGFIFLFIVGIPLLNLPNWDSVPEPVSPGVPALVYIGALVIIAFFLLVLIEILRKRVKPTLILPKLLGAIGAGILATTMGGDELWGACFASSFPKKFLVWIVCFFLACLILHSQTGDRRKTCQVISLGLFYSFALALLSIFIYGNFIGEPTRGDWQTYHEKLAGDNFLTAAFNRPYVVPILGKVYPQIVLEWTFIALFIGVLLNLFLTREKVVD